MRSKSWLAMFVGSVLAVVLLSASAPAAATPDKEDPTAWQFAITPYIWLPSLSGSMKLEPSAGDASGNLDNSSDNSLENLDFVGMLDLQVRKGQWSLLADVIYLDFSDNGTAQFPGALPGGGEWTTAADWQLQALVFEFAGAYSVWREGGGNLDLLAGIRYTTLEGEASLDIAGPLPDWVRSPTYSKTESYVDPIIGLRGNLGLGQKWFLPYYFDVGGFGVDADLTLQAFAGIGYHFADWFSTVLGYRYLYYDFGGESELMEDLSLYGGTLGFNFTF
ncbi:MAG: hypothetical protein HY911_15960 [Desulfobacterales bacterium]|nr:hypothetical protein [Desulfobacterales bacterium]